MIDPEQIKVGDVVNVCEEAADHPGISMVTKIGEHDGDITRVQYRRLLGPHLRTITNERDYVVKLRYIDKIDRRQVAKMFENVRHDLEEAERIVSDAMFGGIEYVTGE